MPLFEIFSITSLAALAWLWFDSIKARDRAMSAVQHVCAAEGVQLLDATVAVVRLRPARTDAGQLVLHRTYAFEYSDTGNNRRPGRILMLGQAVESVIVG
jgi:hypothetical protein